jgi:predicted ATP-grasp superfamily ATP-dependent carboligase
MQQTTRGDADAPPAIIIGLDSLNGLQTARLLAARGVPVIGIARDRQHPFARTRAVREVWEADTTGPGFVDRLVSEGPRLGGPAVLVPCQDMGVLYCSRERERLAPWYRMVLPSAETVELLMDKLAFQEWALSEGLPIPPTRLLRVRADAEAAARELHFPCILKPTLKTSLWQDNAASGVYRVERAEDLLPLYDRCADWAPVLVVQEWIEGSDAELFSCNVYFDRDGEVAATFVARKLRQWPPHAGTSSLGEEIRNDEVLRETLRLFRAADYRGLGYVEMKRDARTGRHYVIEPNVGRPTGRSALAEACGVELHYAAYCDALGWPLPEQPGQTYRGTKWLYLRRDFQTAFHYWRSGELSLAEWIRSWRGPKTWAVYAPGDLRPFFADWLLAVRQAVLGRERARKPQEPKRIAGTASAER